MKHMLLKNKHKINHIKIIINICIIVIYSIIFINKVALANEGVCIDNGCHETRVIKVLVLYDDEFFFEKGWENNLYNRFAEINDFYYSNFKIKWEVIAIKQYSFNKKIEKLSTLFSLHKEDILKLETDAEVVLSIIVRELPGNNKTALTLLRFTTVNATKFKAFVA